MYQQRPPRGPYQPRPNQRFQRSLDFAPRGRGPCFRPRQQNSHYGLHMQSYNKEEYWCETCDRGFSSLDMLESHKQQHQICNIDGCQFVAHPTVITKHIQMQHSSGLFKKIANIKNPEDIQKWREERKKKYPTKENVEKKAAEIKEKIERGEKMGLKKVQRNQNTMGEPQKRKYPYQNEKTEHKKTKNSKPIQNKKNLNKASKKHKELPVPEDNKKLKPFFGIQDLVSEWMESPDLRNSEDQPNDEHCNYEIEDDDDLQGPKGDLANKNENPSICGALSSLICDYGSSSDEAEPLAQTVDRKNHTLEVKNQNAQSKIQKHQQNTETKQNCENIESQNRISNTKSEDSISSKNVILDYNGDSIQKQNESDNDSGPEELNIQKPTENKIVNKNDDKADTGHEKANKLRNKQHIKRPYRPRAKLPSTLIYKLLHREIQQERNIILQCIRHIVKNNYFEKDKLSIESE